MDTVKATVVIYILASISGVYVLLSLLIFFRPSLFHSKRHLHISSYEEVAGDTDAKTEFERQVEEKQNVLEYEVEVSDDGVFVVCEENKATEKDVVDENSPSLKKESTSKIEDKELVNFEVVLTNSKKVHTIISVNESDQKDLKRDELTKSKKIPTTLGVKESDQNLEDLEKDVVDENSPSLKKDKKNIKFEDVLTKSKKIPTIIRVIESDQNLEGLKKIHDLIKKHNRMGLVIWGSTSRKTRHVLTDLDDSMLVYHRPSWKLYMYYFTGFLSYVTFDSMSVLIISHCFRKKVDGNGSLSLLSKLHESLSNMFLWSLGPMINHLSKRGIRTYLIGSNQNDEKVPAGISLIIDDDNMLPATMSEPANCEQRPESNTSMKQIEDVNGDHVDVSDTNPKSVVTSNSDTTPEPVKVTAQKSKTSFISDTTAKYNATNTALKSSIHLKSDTTPKFDPSAKSVTTPEPVKDTAWKSKTSFRPDPTAKSVTTPEPVKATTWKSKTSFRPDPTAKSVTTPEPVKDTAWKSKTSFRPDTTAKSNATNTALKSSIQLKCDTTPKSDPTAKYVTTPESDPTATSETTPESVTIPEHVKATAGKSKTLFSSDTTAKSDATNTALKSSIHLKSDTTPKSDPTATSVTTLEPVKATAWKSKTSFRSDTTAKSVTTPEPVKATTWKSKTSFRPDTTAKSVTTPEPVKATAGKSKTSFRPDTTAISVTTPEPVKATAWKSKTAFRPDTTAKYNATNTALTSSVHLKSDTTPKSDPTATSVTTPESVTALKSDTSFVSDISTKSDRDRKSYACPESDTTRKSYGRSQSDTTRKSYARSQFDTTRKSYARPQSVTTH